MGRIASNVKKIGAVSFEPMASNRVRSDVVKAVCFGGAVYLLTKTDRIFTNSELGRKAVYTSTGSDFHGVRALQALGIITAEERLRHGEGKRRHDVNYAKYRAVNHAAKEFADAGIALTPKQKEKLQIMKDCIDFDDLPWFVQKEARQLAAAAGAKS